MKAPRIFSIIALLSSSVLAAPSQTILKDDQAFNNSVTSTGKAISSGIYLINSPFFEDSSFRIGRSAREDRSLLPKRILSVSKNSYAQTQWDVRQLDNGNYRLSIGRAPTAQINQQLYAVLLDQPAPTEWKIDYQERHNAYTISVADNYQGWVVTDQEVETQIQVRPLIVGPAFPPFYPSTELFTFEPVDDSDSIDDVFHEKHAHAKQGVHVDITISVDEEL